MERELPMGVKGLLDQEIKRQTENIEEMEDQLFLRHLRLAGLKAARNAVLRRVLKGTP